LQACLVWRAWLRWLAWLAWRGLLYCAARVAAHDFWRG